MLDIFNTPTPQSANYQEFYGGGSTRDWIKPRGASMVRMLLIGAGAGGRAGPGGTGGGSGALTSWIGPAIFIPDQLRITIGAGGASGAAGGNTTVLWQGPSASAGYTLLTANGAASNVAGTVSTNNYFGASGIFNSVAGQAGAGSGASLAASTTTFLAGGGGGSNTATAAAPLSNLNYGYGTLAGGLGTVGGNGNNGFFLTQPIMIGVGGSGGGGGTTLGGNGGNGGIGCGGGGGGRGTTTSGIGGKGGDGAVFIWAW